MAIKDCSDADKFARDHAISKEVWDSRPYKRWTPNDLTALDAEFGPRFSLRHKVSRVVTDRIGDEFYGHNGSGWIMYRYAIDPADLPHVYAEIRPDNAVELRPPRSHFHGEMDEFPYEIIEVKKASMIGGPKWVHYKCPEGSDVETRWVACYGPRSFAMVGRDPIPGGHINRSKDKGQDNHAGVNTNRIHAHVEEAKYLFNPSDKIDRYWEHSHDDEHYTKNPDALAGHLANRKRADQHGGAVVGPHVHWDRVKDPDRNHAARIDVHPMAAKRLVSADVVFFALEGCIKADALLTAIIREGRNATVISVPSVSLWDCPEFALAVSRYLYGKTVVIVVDADGVDNPRVVNQAAMCQTLLLKHGVANVLVTAPALDVDGKIIEDKDFGKLKGVDDFLAAGFKLGDLAVTTAIAPIDQIRDLANALSKRKDFKSALFDTMFAFSTFAGESGQLHAPQQTVAKVLGVPQQTLSDRMQRLYDAGVITVWADPVCLKAGKLTSKQDWRGRWDWEERPFLLLAEPYRATVIRHALGDVL